MLNRKDKAIIFLVLLVALSYPYVLSQTPPGPNTLEHGQGINTPSVTTEHYYLGATEVTNILGYPIQVGTATNSFNGTWIAHNCDGDPGTTGSITLSLRDPSSYNATFILRVPTVLSSNSTHFQIEFLAWETAGWTQVPVTIVEAQTVYWFAKYTPP